MVIQPLFIRGGGWVERVVGRREGVALSIRKSPTRSAVVIIANIVVMKTCF